MSNHVEEDDAALCERLLGGEDAADARAAYARFLASRRPRRIAWGPVGMLAAAVVVVLLVVTPLGSVAQSFLTIFQPKTVAPIDLSSIGHARLLPDLNEFGTLRGGSARLRFRKVDSLAAASALARFRALTPARLPSQLTRAPHAKVYVGERESFTFSAARTRASAARKKQRLPAMPAELNGTTITVSLGPAIAQTWKDADGKDGLTVVQSIAPVVRSSGASLRELESYLLSVPGVSPQLAAQIRAIGDPSSTLPVPFLANKQTAQRVTVDGSSGVAVGDNTGVGAGVVWEKNGKIYVVFGALAQDQVLNVADSLH